MTYYFSIDGHSVGPLNSDEIKEKITQGKIHLDTLAWKQGLQEWVQVKHLSELLLAFPELKRATVTPPPLPPQPRADRASYSKTTNNLQNAKYAVIGSGIANGALLLVAFVVLNLWGIVTVLPIIGGIYQAYKYIDEGKLEDAKKYSLGTGIACGVLGVANLVLQSTVLPFIWIAASVSLFYAAKQLGNNTQ